MAALPITTRLSVLGDTIQFVSNVVALPVGTIGNILTILVMLRPHMRTSSASVYFAAIAMFDLGILYGAIPSDLAGWNRFGTGNSYSSFTCSLSLFMVRTNGTASQYCLLALAVDRMIAVRLPLKAKTLCTVSRAVKVCVAIYIPIALKTMHVFWTRGSQELPGPNGSSVVINCGYTSPEAEYFLREVNSWLGLVISCYLPVVPVIVINILIISGLRKQTRVRLQHTHGDQNDGGRRSLSVMLVVASTIMLLLITPNFIVQSIVPVVLQTSTPRGIDVFIFLRKVTVCMGVQNHAVNFLIYVVTGSRFRSELKRMFTPGCRSGDQNNASFSTQSKCRSCEGSGGTRTPTPLTVQNSTSTAISGDTIVNEPSGIHI